MHPWRLGSSRPAAGQRLESTLWPLTWCNRRRCRAGTCPRNYSTHFYNWPYTFGLLFGLGLYAAYQEDPERFRDGYDDLLASSGLADASGLAARFGIDVGREEFWASSLEVLGRRIDQFERLAFGS